MADVFQTDEPDLAEAILQDSYGGKIRIDPGHRPGGFWLEAAPLTSQVRLDHMNWGMNFGVSASPTGVLIIAQICSGHASYRSGGSERAYGPGDLFISVQPDDPCTCHR